MQGRIKIIAERCKACHLCIEVCKKEGISKGSELNAAGYVPVVFCEDCGCNGCRLCAIRCPEVAIEVYLEE